MGASTVSDAFVCFWDPYPSPVLPCPALIWWDVPSVTVTWYTTFGWKSWEVFSFLKENGGVDLGDRGDRELGTAAPSSLIPYSCSILLTRIPLHTLPFTFIFSHCLFKSHMCKTSFRNVFLIPLAMSTPRLSKVDSSKRFSSIMLTGFNFLLTMTLCVPSEWLNLLKERSYFICICLIK